MEENDVGIFSLLHILSKSCGSRLQRFDLVRIRDRDILTASAKPFSLGENGHSLFPGETSNRYRFNLELSSQIRRSFASFARRI